MSKPSIGDRFYAFLLRLLPFDFRSEYGSDMEETFRQQRADIETQHGFAALAKMWGSTIRDIVRMAPREHLSVLSQDVRYALRMMRKNAGYTAAAVLILGLGIGANTSVFSVVNSVLLQPLPYQQGDDLVVLRQPQTKLGVQDAGFSPMELDDYRRSNRSLAGIEEYHAMTFLLFGRSETHRVKVGVVSPKFFDLFGVKPLLGRAFVPDDDKPGAEAVLVLSYEFWKQIEGGDPKIVGRVYRMNDKPHTVVGVLPAIPQYPDENDVYMPTSACPARSNPRNIASRNFRLISLFGRRKPEASVEMCHRDLAMISQRLQQDNPKDYPDRAGFAATVSALRSDLTQRARPMLLVLLGAAACVLLIACANVANLVLARMARREQELVIRTAVGAGSGRLLRQLLTESFLMAILSAAVGMVFAVGSIRLLTQFAGLLTPRAREIAIDGWVLAFAIVCATITTMVFGSVAALYSRSDVASGLKDTGRASERSRTLVRSTLIAAQVAFSFLLLAGAGLMVRSFIHMNRVDPGFVPQRLVAVGVRFNGYRYNTEEKRIALAQRLLQKMQGQPGVVSAALSSSFPLDPEQAGGGGNPAHFRIEGDARPESELPPIGAGRSATTDYFKTLGIPIIAGRQFLDSDNRESAPVVIVNRAAAVRAWPNQDPIGRRISMNNGQTWLTIVGVAGDTKEFGLGSATPNVVYRPVMQTTFVGAVLLRTAGESQGIAEISRRAIREVDSETAITRVITMEQARADSVASPRTMARLFGLFAVLASLIAVTGIGSMLALWVRQRSREIGIRMALGAKPNDIVGSVIRQGMVLAAIGLGLGLAGSLWMTRFLKRLLFQVDPTDGLTFSMVSVMLLTAALVACYIPARRASRIDPQVALRAE